LADRLAVVLWKNPVVLAIPRGGVEVGGRIADRLAAPLDVILPRKIGAPMDPELAIGAVTEEGEAILDSRISQRYGVSAQYIQETTHREQAEIVRRTNLYREGRAPLSVDGRDVIVVDDGIATGATMKAAIISLRRKSPARLIVAVPVSSLEAMEMLTALVDLFITLEAPRYFLAVGQFYEDFGQTSDETVRLILEQANQQPGKKGCSC
jgi:predicted phosphoribosyltransferase